MVFFLNALFSSLILSLLDSSGRIFLLLLPCFIAWRRCVLSYPSVSMYRPLLSHKTHWMIILLSSLFLFSPVFSILILPEKTSLLWSFAEVRYIISKLGLLSAFCSELVVIAFILLQFTVIMVFSTFCDIFFIYLEQKRS